MHKALSGMCKHVVTLSSSFRNFSDARRVCWTSWTPRSAPRRGGGRRPRPRPSTSRTSSWGSRPWSSTWRRRERTWSRRWSRRSSRWPSKSNCGLNNALHKSFLKDLFLPCLCPFSTFNTLKLNFSHYITSRKIFKSILVSSFSRLEEEEIGTSFIKVSLNHFSHFTPLSDGCREKSGKQIKRRVFLLTRECLECL